MNERELFNGWWDDNNLPYENDDKDKKLAWEAWQASANREGYKLVPVVDTDAMWSAGRFVIEEGGYCTDASDVYKAMIGAVDDH